MRTLLTCLAALLALGVSTTAVLAQPLRVRATSGERRLSLLTAHQKRLETRLGEHSKRITRLKGQPTSVARDLQLRSALRASAQLAGRLTKLQGSLREVRKALLGLYDQAIDQAKDDKTRGLWQERKRKLLTAQRHQLTRIATGGRARPLDGVEDLEEKADLLKDSEAKIRRQLARVSRRITRLSQRAKLRRHGHAATATPFVEDRTRRLGGSRAAGAGKSAGKGESRDDGPANRGPGAANDHGFAGAPAPPSGGGNKSAGLGADHDGATSPLRSSSLRSTLDQATLKALRGAHKGSLRARLAALEKAKANLARLAEKLAARSAALRAQAHKRELTPKAKRKLKSER